MTYCTGQKTVPVNTYTATSSLSNYAAKEYLNNLYLQNVWRSRLFYTLRDIYELLTPHSGITKPAQGKGPNIKSTKPFTPDIFCASPVSIRETGVYY